MWKLLLVFSVAASLNTSLCVAAEPVELFQLLENGELEEAVAILAGSYPDRPIMPWVAAAIFSSHLSSRQARQSGLESFWKAESLAAELTEWDKSHTEVFGGLGYYCFTQDDLECAVAYLKVAVYLSPEHETYRLLYGLALYRSGNERESSPYLPKGFRQFRPRFLDSPLPHSRHPRTG